MMKLRMLMKQVTKDKNRVNNLGIAVTNRVDEA